MSNNINFKKMIVFSSFFFVLFFALNYVFMTMENQVNMSRLLITSAMATVLYVLLTFIFNKDKFSKKDKQ